VQQNRGDQPDGKHFIYFESTARDEHEIGCCLESWGYLTGAQR